jgi:hypothetical protein
MAQITWNKVAGKPALARLWARAQDQSGTPAKMTRSETIDAIQEFLELFPEADAGGGHITLSDFNNEAWHIGGCIIRLTETMGTMDDRSDAEAIHFLGCLLRLDEEERVASDETEYGWVEPADEWSQPEHHERN